MTAAPAPARPLWRNPYLWLIAGYLLYAALYIWHTSVVVEGERYFVLFDDGMISMRYARHLVEGYGLVWNPGEQPPIEGYTNPLWVLYMAALHLLPVPLAQLSVLVQATGALCVAGTVLVTRRIAEYLTSGWTATALAACVFTAFYLPLNNWSLMGMEVGALTLTTTLATWQALRDLRAQSFTPWLYLLLGVATLIRVDAVVPLFALWSFLVVTVPTHRRAHLLAGALTLAVFLGGQTLWRLSYYGDIFPNTYYLKVTGISLTLRLLRGVYMAAWFVWRTNWILFCVPFAVWLFRRDRTVGLLFWVCAGQLAYSVYVGGDTWEDQGGANRYLCLAMPLFFVLMAYAGEQAVRYGDPRYRARHPLLTALGRPLQDARLLLVLLALATVLNGVGYACATSTIEAPSPCRTAILGLASNPLALVGLLALVLGALGVLLWRARRAPAAASAPPGPLSPRAMRYAYLAFCALALLNLNATSGPGALAEWLLLSESKAVTDNRIQVHIARVLTRTTTPQASVALVLAGVVPYFSARPAIDLLGKTDAVIAHEPMHRSPVVPLGFWPGHSKWDYARSLGVLKPDVITQLWWLAGDEAEPYLRADYVAVELEPGVGVYARRDSPAILWEKVKRVAGR